MYLITVLLIILLLMVIFSPCLSNYKFFTTYEFYENHDITYDQLNENELSQYNTKISQLDSDISSESFTIYEIINRDIAWLNKKDNLDESEIFGYNRFNEPIRFVLVYSPVNNQHYVKPEFYRANRWCRQIHDTSMNLCPHKPSPKFDLSDTSRWQYLLDASSVELNRLFEEKYGSNPDYDKMYQAFQWYAGSVLSVDADGNTTERRNYFKADDVNTSQAYADYLASVDELDKEVIPVNDPAAISWITSDNMAQEPENTSGIFNFFGGVSLGNTNQYPSCNNMSVNSSDTSNINNYGANPFGFIFNNTPIVNATPYPFTNPTVGGSCGNLDVNGEKTKVCFFK